MYTKKDWDTTRDSYLRWLNNTGLKKEFCKKIRYKNLALWWITKLVDKDIVLDNKWYISLNHKLNKKKNIKKNHFFYLIFFLKLIKNFLLNIFFITFIKIFFRTKNSNKKKKENCYYSRYENLTNYKNIILNGCFSFAPINKKRENCYLTELQLNKKLIKDFFKIKKNISKLPVENHILHNYISYTEIFNIYFKILLIFFKAIKISGRKNYFMLGSNNCLDILKPRLLDSFCGNIQNALIISESVQNFLRKNQYKKFITNGEFYPNFRAIYFFIKTLENSPKIIMVNHADYHKDNLFLQLNKKDFDNKTKPYLQSPKPDIFFSQGSEYAKYLNNFFPRNKIFTVGSFKFDLAKQKSQRKIIRNKIKKLNNGLVKKIIVVLTSLKDEDYIVNFLNKCNLSNYQIVLCPHPAFKNFTNQYFIKNFNYNYTILKNYSSREVIDAADLIISGYASLAYEGFFRRLNVVRVSDYHRPNWTDEKDHIPVLKNPANLNQYLFNKKKIPNSFIKKTEKKYFYKFDQKTYRRFCNIINRL